MYEFNNKPPQHGVRRGDFGFRRWERLALIKFAECPRILTLVMHAELQETTPLHCWCADTRKQVDLFAPKQAIISKTSASGVNFLILKVLTKKGIRRWLVVCTLNRQGFLLEERMFDRYLGLIAPRQLCKSKKKRRARRA